MSPNTPDRIQPGVYFRHREQPPACWRLLLLDLDPGITPAEASTALTIIARMLAALPAGTVPELQGQPLDGVEATRATFRNLACLWAFGRTLFDEARHDPPLTRAERPPFLAFLAGERHPFPALPWAADEERGRGEADVALQLSGPTEATVNRAALEVWKLVVDDGLPVRVVALFGGFARPDGRGWLEFHDGVSNIESSQRRTALEATGDPEWMRGGTYMAFLRCRVDLRAWRALERGEQELLVGRDKLTGAPLRTTERDSEGRACPVAAEPLSRDAGAVQIADYHDPPQATDPLIEASHLHRANQNRASPHAPAAWRMFRQGYDFLDGIGPEGPTLGLNFVSFQADLGALHHVLRLPGWLADVNFGGPARPGPGEPEPVELVKLLAGGLYAVPPVAEPFAGAVLFAEP
jgi:Dyp-type peroxidase family